ncbi:hypothetical protein YC2023_118102 [Brassica napus]
MASSSAKLADVAVTRTKLDDIAADVTTAEILELDENLNKEFHEFKKNLRRHMQLRLQVLD